MRLAYVCMDPGVPVFGRKGSSIHCQEVIRAFRSQGFDIDLFARRLGNDVPADLATIHVHQIGGKLGSEIQQREEALAAANPLVLATLEKNGPFDLVYERYSLWNCAAMQYASEANVPGILEVNSPLIHEQQTYRQLVNEAEAKVIRAKCFKNASSIVAVSDEVADRVRSNYYASDKTTTLANGVNCRRFDSVTDARKGPASNLIIGFLGTLKPWHGVSILLDAFANVRDVCQNARLRIVGDGPERERLESQARRYPRHVLQSIEWVGAIAHADIPATLARFDIAVAPYPDLQDFYFSPLKVLEYMAAGMPIVASDIGQIPRLIGHNHTGLLVKSGCVDQLASAILRLCGDRNLRERIGQEARSKAVQQHTWNHVVTRILDTVSLPTCVAEAR